MENRNQREQAPHKRGAPTHVAAMTLEERRTYLSTLGKRSGEVRRRKRLEQDRTTPNQSEQIERTIIERLTRTTQTDRILLKTELDTKIEWLSAAIEALQAHAPMKYNEIRRLDETLAKLLEVQTKVRLALEDKLMTDRVWEGVQGIVTSTVADEGLRHQVLLKIANFFDALVKEAEEEKGNDRHNAKV